MQSHGPTSGSVLLGYARGDTTTSRLDDQLDALISAGVDPERVYSDRPAATSASRPPSRPGLAALLDYARSGDVAVVVGIDRLGHSVGEIMATAHDLSHRGIGLRSLREGLDTDDPAGAMIVGVLASLSEVTRPPGRDGGRSPGRTVGATVGRPRALDADQVALAEQLRAQGQPVPAIAATLGVSRATLYRSLSGKRTVR